MVFAVALGSANLPLEKSGGTGPRRYGTRTAVPLLPGQQSKAERLAHGKNRVLQRRLQYSLDNITRDRNAWLSGVHIEAMRYRRRVLDLNKRISDQLNGDLNANNPRDGLTSASAPVSPRVVTPRWERPATSLDVRPPGSRTPRPKTAGRPQLAAADALWKDENVYAKPLFKVRGNKVKTNSSEDDDEDDMDSDEDLSSANDCDDSIFDAVRAVNSRQEQRLRENVNTVPSKQGGNTWRTRSANFKNTRSLHINKASENTFENKQQDPRTKRSMTSLGQVTARDHQKKSPRDAASSNNRMRRAKTAVNRPWNLRRPTMASTECTAFRDADYVRFVLDIERDKYELSQMKVRNYLQNLKI